MEILRRDPGTGIQCGVNDLGKLFLGDVCCWYNMADTPENREIVEKYSRKMFAAIRRKKRDS